MHSKVLSHCLNEKSADSYKETCFSVMIRNRGSVKVNKSWLVCHYRTRKTFRRTDTLRVRKDNIIDHNLL